MCCIRINLFSDFNTIPSSDIMFISRENLRTNANGTTLMSQAKLSAILCLFTYILNGKTRLKTIEVFMF